MDTQTRDLQRRWQQSNNPEDEALYLRGRGRIGELTLESIQIAAYVGYPAARIIDENTRPTKEAEKRLDLWIFGLQIWGKNVLVEAARSLAVSTLRATKAIEGGENLLTLEQLKLLDEVLRMSATWEGKKEELLTLSQKVYDLIYESVEEGPVASIGSSFSWLCYAAAWDFTEMESMSEDGVNGPDNTIHAAIMTAGGPSTLDSDMTITNLKRDLAAWALRDLDG